MIAEDACTTLSQNMHQGALDIFRLAFGQVKATEEIIAVLAAAAASGQNL